MTQEQFDNYSFSLYTEVVILEDKWGKVWEGVSEVNFKRRTIGIERGQIYDYSEIKDIRN